MWTVTLNCFTDTVKPIGNQCGRLMVWELIHLDPPLLTTTIKFNPNYTLINCFYIIETNEIVNQYMNVQQLIKVGYLIPVYDNGFNEHNPDYNVSSSSDEDDEIGM